MCTKATPYDNETIFYFDDYGNKYVAIGGSLSWRANNPGLVHTHSITALQAIGVYGQISIFPSLEQGEKVLYEWLRCKKYAHSSLMAIARHYEPKNPKKFLKKLCDLAQLKDSVKIFSLSEKEFQRLVWAIKQLVGYSSTGDEEFYVLPKVSARFYRAHSAWLLLVFSFVSPCRFSRLFILSGLTI